MNQIILCVRKPGKLEIEDWCTIAVPAIPQIGDYISLSSLDVREPLSEDLIVRRVWWRLRKGPNGPESVGGITEVFVECDISVGPYASREWQERIAFERDRGIKIESFEVARITVGLGNDLSNDHGGESDAA